MQPVNGGIPSLDFEPSEVFRQPSLQSIGQLAACSTSLVDMEQESEGRQVAAMPALELDSKVRAEANLGFQQISSIEQQLRTAPQGFLGRADVSDAQALRTTIFSASVTIVGSFTRIIGLLSANPPNFTSFRNDKFSASNLIGRVESSLSTCHTCDSTAPHSPLPRAPTAAPNSKEPMINSTSPVISPVTTPHSGMSEDSPYPASPPVLLDSDGDVAAADAAVGRPRRPAKEATASADFEVVKQRRLSVKRKFMPKISVKQRASGTDPGNDGPPDDGHTWRKYGQKDILGLRNPRSYYRCTHKNELGCSAIKYVQRCDDEPLVFDVTYRGSHTCQSIHQQYPAWPFSCSSAQVMLMTGAHKLSPSDSPAKGSYPSTLGGSHVVNSPATQQSREILLGGTSSTRLGFSQVTSGLLMGGIVPSTSAILDASSGPSRFGLGPTAMELGAHQQYFPVKAEDSNPAQQQVFDVDRLGRETTLFGDSSSMLQMLMASSRPSGQNGLSSTLVEDDLRSHVDLKRVKMLQYPMELAEDTSGTNCGQVDKSAQHRYPERWGPELDSDDFQLQLDEQVPLRYDNSSSVISGNSRELPSNQKGAVQRGRNVAIEESDTSEQTPVSSLPVVFLDDMDYESSFPGSSTFYC